MGKKNQNKKSKQTDQSDKHSKMLETVMYSTIKELAVDINSSQLSDIINNLTPTEVIVQLGDKTSKLYESIPKSSLESNNAGKKYLDILSVVQPDLKPTLIQDSSSSSSSSSSIKDINEDDILKGVNSILGVKNGENNKLISLASSLCKELDLNKKLDMNNLGDMNNIMSLIPDISSFVENKIKKGELNMEELQEQANDVCTKMQTSNDFQNLMKNCDASQIYEMLGSMTKK
jgi:hypothetical protein